MAIKTIELDSNFFTPYFIEDLVVVDDQGNSSPTDDELDGQWETDSDDDSETDDDVGDDVEVPQAIQIVSQTVRTAPDGSQVVDVVIEVDDVPEAVQYDVRVAKA